MPSSCWNVSILCCLYLLFQSTASEEFLELTKSALLAALEGNFIQNLKTKIHFSSVWLCSEGEIFSLVFLYCSSKSRGSFWACYVQPQNRTVWCSRTYTSCKKCIYSPWCGEQFITRTWGCHALVTVFGSGMVIFLTSPLMFPTSLVIHGDCWITWLGTPVNRLSSLTILPAGRNLQGSYCCCSWDTPTNNFLGEISWSSTRDG